MLDTWHNSGSAPYSSLTDKEYKNEIPAPFFTEGIDQTRGWAYTLLVENVILNNTATSPYDAFLFQGHVLDEKGNKMSKSRGNVLDGEKLLDKYSADLVRFYFIWKSSPIEPLNFDTRELMSRPYQVLSTIYHMHLYYTQNSRYDNFTDTTIEWAQDKNLLRPADIWLLSKLQRLIVNVTALNDKCRLHEYARSIEDFIINSLSQVYIPITREDLWDEGDSGRDRRFAVYAVLCEALMTLDILIHPLCPHVSEYLYQSTFGKNDSILLERWPEPQKPLINGSVEDAFDLMKECVSVCSAARMKAGLKRRWPLDEAIICLDKGHGEKLEPLSELLTAQLNVEKYTIHELQCNDDLERIVEMKELGLPIRPIADLDRGQIGPKARRSMGDLVKKHLQTDPWEILDSLRTTSQYTFELKENITLDREDFIVSFDAADGFALSSRGRIVVIISTHRSPEMTARGLVRDVARRIQTLRKERGYNPTDILGTASILGLDEESQAMIQDKSSELAFLVRVKRIDFDGACTIYKDENIDGNKIRIGVQ